jgi:hypothetical protein
MHPDAPDRRASASFHAAASFILTAGLLGAAAAVVACGSSGSSVTEPGGIRTSSSALTASQCSYLAENGKTNICHYTGSAKKPYNLLSVDIGNCDFHAANHPNDFVTLTGDCGNPGCLPDGAPVQTNSYPFKPPCCSGQDPAFGVCQPAPKPAPASNDLCTFTLLGGSTASVDCPPVSNPSCYQRDCNPATGFCETSILGGRGCPNECETDADCIPTVNGVPDRSVVSTCVLSGDLYICEYATPSCDDGNACTKDWLDVAAGCQHTPIAGCTP